MDSVLCLPDHTYLGGKVIKCSPQVWDKLALTEGLVTVRFGSKIAENVFIKRTELKNEYSNVKTESYFIATFDLMESLLLPERLPYKLRWLEEGTIEIGPTIGFLLGDSPHSYTPEYMKKFMDRFQIYNEIEGFICAFAEENINWDQRTVYGLYYNPTGTTLETQWDYGVFPIPNVIYRRYFHNKKETIERLNQVTQYRLFNSSRFSKYEFYKNLVKDPELASHLPKTDKLSLNPKFLSKYLLEYKKVILKPIDLSRGRGILYIHLEKGRQIHIIDHRGQHPEELYLSTEKLVPYLKRQIPNPKKYIIQQLIPITKIDDCPFDIRVVMQKDGRRYWVCNGMEARHAVMGSYVTNLAKGGHATSVEEAVAKAYSADNEQVGYYIERIKMISERICRQIELANPDHHFAEFGIDLGMDKNGKIWIIEANVYPSFKGIKHFKMDQYMDIRFTPMRYAYAISGFN